MIFLLIIFCVMIHWETIMVDMDQGKRNWWSTLFSDVTILKQIEIFSTLFVEHIGTSGVGSAFANKYETIRNSYAISPTTTIILHPPLLKKYHQKLMIKQIFLIPIPIQPTISKSNQQISPNYHPSFPIWTKVLIPNIMTTWLLL